MSHIYCNITAVIHLDEATPHLHVDFVPFATEQKRGLSTRNSLTKALEQQGIIAATKAERPAKQWTDLEKQHLSEVMLRHGIKWKQLGTHNEHLSVLDFKKQERAKEVRRLDSEISSKNLILEWRQEAIECTEQDLDKLGSECMKKRAEVEQLDSEIYEKENKKAQTEAELAEKKAILNESAHKVFKLDFIDKIETGKTVFSGKITISPDDYNRLTDLAKKQIAAESQENSLRTRITTLETQNQALITEKEQLTKQNEQLRKENGELQSNYGRIVVAKLRSELDNLQRKLDRVMEFIESLGLKEKLERFLHPIIQHKRR